MSAPKKLKSALKKLCDRAKSALNSQARISSPGYGFYGWEHGVYYTLVYLITSLLSYVYTDMRLCNACDKKS